MEGLFEYACSYRNNYGFSVIPVGTNKKPLVKWTEYQKRLPNDAELDSFFLGETFESVSIGLITGEISGVCVIDNDNGEIAVDSNLKVKTARGYHCYFKYRKGVRNRSKLDGDPVDIRGEGGYVVIPPSKHKSGIIYQWEYKEKSFAEALKNLQEFPDDLFEKYFMSNEYLNKIRTVEYEKMDKLVKGERDDEIFSYARSLFTYYLPFSRVLAICRQSNSKLTEPLPDDVVIEKVKSAQRYHEIDDTPKLKIGSIVMKEYIRDVTEDKHKEITITGIDELDKMFGKLELGRLYTLVAGSGQGKSIFGIQVFDESITQGKSAMYLSNELDSTDIISRLVARRTGYTWRELNHNSPLIDKREIERARKEIGELLSQSNSGTAIQMKTIPLIESTIRMAHNVYGIDIFILDHIHNIRGETDIYTRVSEIAHKMQELTQELNICTVMLGQLSQATQKEQNPDIVSAKGSMEVIDVSDGFMYLQRPAFNNNKDEKTKLYLAKNRSGGIVGMIDLSFVFPNAIIYSKSQLQRTMIKESEKGDPIDNPTLYWNI